MKKRRKGKKPIRVLHDVQLHCLSIDKQGHEGLGFQVERSSLEYVDEAVEMTPEQFEHITERLKGRTFSHERISTTEESWWAGARRLFRERNQRLNELTQGDWYV